MSDNLSPPTLNLLCDELKDVVEWDIVAIHLEVDNIDIQDSRERYRGIQQHKSHCLQKWLDQTNTIHSWRTVADAVDKVNSRVADSIRTKYATIIDLVPSHSQHVEYQMHRCDACHNNEDDDQDSFSTPVCILPTNIIEAIANLLDRFAQLLAETQKQFEKRPDLLTQLDRYVKTLTGITTLPDGTEATYKKLFDALDNNNNINWHYLNCLLLQKIVEVFLSDTELPGKVQIYQEDATAFMNSKETKDFVKEILSKQENGSILLQVVLIAKQTQSIISKQQLEIQLHNLIEECNEESYYDIFVRVGNVYRKWSVSENAEDMVGPLCYNMTSNNTLPKDNVNSNDINSSPIQPVRNGVSFQLSLHEDVTQIKGETTDIYVASQNGHFSVVSILLNNGAEPNITTNNGWTPLMIASQNGHDNIVELLLNKNVPVNTQNTDGMTAIYIASQNNHFSVVSILLNNGAEPNITTNNGWTPLMIASQNGHDNIVELLLNKNVPVNTQNTDGMTAIYIASQNNHFSVVSILLNNGAEPNVTTNSGWTPLMIASQNGLGNTVELLLNKNKIIC